MHGFVFHSDASPDTIPSEALFLFGIIMYITVTIPALNTIVAPKHLVEADDRTEAIRVLAAGNTLIAGFLIGVLLMQVSYISPQLPGYLSLTRP
jgi:hypothetical protein